VSVIEHFHWLLTVAGRVKVSSSEGAVLISRSVEHFTILTVAAELHVQ
jgi:hypothetical protein